MNSLSPTIHKIFARAYILGGSPCSGKSTVAERLAAQFHLHYYKVDDHEHDHATRCHPERHPVMFKYSQMSWNDIWSRPAALQVQEEFAYYRERFEMIVDDLTRENVARPLILEGAAYLPELLSVCHAPPEHVLYLVPTKAFQVHHYRQRPWIQHILNDCDDPERAFENWMMRDHLFGQEILRQAHVHNYATRVIDGKQSIDAQCQNVSIFFGLS